MSKRPLDADVAVLGAGPAGVAVAVGLARLGYSVLLYADRMRGGLEGASPRVLQALTDCGLHATLASIEFHGERTRDWAGTRLVNGIEYLIDRSRFDVALRKDAVAAGVRLIEERVSGCELMARNWTIASRGSSLRTGALVEARGRRVRGAASRAPRLLALVQRFDVAPGEPASGVAMGRAGWYWFAADGAGRLDVQAVGAPAGSSSRAALWRRLFDPAAVPALVATRLDAAQPRGEPRACAAGAACREPAAVAGRVLVGDAAMSVDPLSGHGIYEALANAPANIAAVNTWLQGGDWELVRMFLQERSQELWSRKLAAAGSFYREAAGVDGDMFWERTAQAYAALASQRAILHDPTAGIQTRPVLNGTRIELRRVLIARGWPRGVWRYRDIELAALLDCWELEGCDAARAAVQLQRPEAAVRAALQWLQEQGALPPGGAGGFRRTGPSGAFVARSST